MTWIVSLLLLGAWPVWSLAEPAPPDYRLDGEFFRRGLIDRGLDEWLRIYDKQHPPLSDVDLLAQQIGRAWLEYRRAGDSVKRGRALEELLSLELDRVESYPDHPLSANWRVRYAGDLLNEKLSSPAFIHLLGLDLPTEARAPFEKCLAEIELQLAAARKFLQGKLGEFDRLDNAQLTQINRQGLPELYQASLLQSDYLFAWCQYHRARLQEPGSPAQVKVLYPLSDAIGRLVAGGGETASGGGHLLAAAVARMLGEFPQAQAAIREARKSLPASYLLFASLEEAQLALAQNQPGRAVKILAGCHAERFYRDEPERRDLVRLAVGLLGVRARLGSLPASEQNDPTVRSRMFADLAALLVEKPALRSLAFPRLLELSEPCPQESLTDIELVAYAERSIQLKKVPLAQNALEDLLSRSDAPGPLMVSGAQLLARTFESQGRFTEAVTVLRKLAARGKEGQTAEILSEIARLAWLAYRANPGDARRAAFIEHAGRLLAQFPQSDSADQFKILMAEELAQTGEFTQALQWIQQVPPGSKLYLQARSARVLTLVRQFREQAQSAGVTTRPGSPTETLAGQIEAACRDVLTIASARQQQPEKVETWTLDDGQAQLIAGTLLAAAGVLSDPALGRTRNVEELLQRYRPILARYEKTSKSAASARILTLTQAGTLTGLIEAVNLARSLLEKKDLPAAQIATTIVGVLEAVHQSVLSRQADPLGPGDELARSGSQLAQAAEQTLGANAALSAAMRERLRVLAVVTAVDAGEYSAAGRALRSLPAKTTSVDLDLARARIHLVEKKFLDAVTISMAILQNTPPSDIGYWHALIVNLRGHLALGSDPAQISAAVVARQQDYPDLGNQATKAELLKILQTAQAKKK